MPNAANKKKSIHCKNARLFADVFAVFCTHLRFVAFRLAAISISSSVVERGQTQSESCGNFDYAQHGPQPHIIAEIESLMLRDCGRDFFSTFVLFEQHSILCVYYDSSVG